MISIVTVLCCIVLGSIFGWVVSRLKDSTVVIIMVILAMLGFFTGCYAEYENRLNRLNNLYLESK
jgi:F0F1-type ATP synthase assembly protein I